MLTGLINCSVPDFVKLFDLLLQQGKAKALDNDIHEGSMLEQVKTILSKAVYAYLCQCTVGKWHVRNKSTGHFNAVCWNCEKEGVL